jgi:tetratricopeptide (TPR) repeat protein
MLLLALMGVARAEMPLPSYRDALVHEAWTSANDLLEAGLLAEAAAKAQEFEDTVTPDGSLEYLIGYSWRLRDDNAQAEAHYSRALELNPDLPEAWSDLGELYLVEGRWDDAERAFHEVDRLVSTGPKSWLGPWRLAEVAAHKGDVNGFEAEMKVALERGFTFRMIKDLPNWQGFYADPKLHDSVEKLITVYGDAETLESLKKP